MSARASVSATPPASPNSKKIRYTVIGAGHGGKAMAAYLALTGHQTTLYNRTPANVAAIKSRQGIDLESPAGYPGGFGRLSLVTSDIKRAIAEGDVIMIVVPSSAHYLLAQQIAPHLRDGQTVILHPGRTGGAIEFCKVLRDRQVTADVTVAETQTFIYASRSDGPAQARIFRVKEAVPLAALPATRTRHVLEQIADVYPEFIDGENVLRTSLDNMGAIFHPALTILNAGRIENTAGNFLFYYDGVTPSVARVLEALDRERVTVAAALGVRAQTAMEWLKMAYDATGEDLNEAIHNNPGYDGITAPRNLAHRYLFEDIPMSLVPIWAFGQRYGVNCKTIEALVNLACVIHRTDYWQRGRTMDRLGIGGFSVSELMRYVTEGTIE